MPSPSYVVLILGLSKIVLKNYELEFTIMI